MEPVVSFRIPQRGSGHVRYLTPPCEGVQWVEGASGCMSASMIVRDPAAAQSMTVDCRVFISDPASGEVVWTGVVARDGLRVSPMGDSATVRCVGNVTDLYASYWSLPYVVRTYDRWGEERIKYASGPSWEATVGTRPVNPPYECLLFRAPDKADIIPGDGGRMAYLGHMGTDMWIGAIECRTDAGTDEHPRAGGGTPTHLVQSIEYGDKFWGAKWDYSWTKTGTFRSAAAGISANWASPPAPHVQSPRDVTDSNYMVISTSFTDATGTTVGGTRVWCAVDQVTVSGQRVDRHGANVPYVVPITTQVNSVAAGEVAEDLVGRCMRDVVDPRSVIIEDATGFRLDQCDYSGRMASAGEVLDDMVRIHPDHLWRLGLVSASTDMASFEWRPWETAARYMVDAGTATIDLDGSPDDLYDRVTVIYTDARGRRLSRTHVADPALYPDIAHLTAPRQPDPFELDERLGSSLVAGQVANAWLGQVATRTPAGTVTLTGPVLDMVTQQMVPPSQVRAGTTLALSSDEPTRVHRVVQAEHDGADVVTLSIAVPRLTLDQIVEGRTR